MALLQNKVDISVRLPERFLTLKVLAIQTADQFALYSPCRYKINKLFRNMVKFPARTF